MEMVRVDKEEEVFDTEVIFGRDTASVFPSEARKVDKAILDAVTGGGNRFVSEAELNELKSKKEGAGAGSGVDENGEPLKPLLQVLKENKDAKDREWEDRMKIIKTGKNRPLDEDEMDFLDQVAREQREKDLEKKMEEDAELRMFREARELKAAAEAKAAAKREAQLKAAAASAPPAAAPKPAAVKRPIAVVKPVVVAAKPNAEAPAAKKAKTEEPAPVAGGLGLGLDYGSGDESD